MLAHAIYQSLEFAVLASLQDDNMIRVQQKHQRDPKVAFKSLRPIRNADFSS